jgi:hypothetical protein
MKVAALQKKLISRISEINDSKKIRIFGRITKYNSVF